MAILFDANILLLTIEPDAPPPHNPNTGQPLEHGRQRVDYLIRKVSKNKTEILIPTPVLCEVLVNADEAINKYIQHLKNPPFRIVEFGCRAAVECAIAIRDSGLRGEGEGNTRAKVKFDRQIVAIAKAEGADTIYSDDAHILKYAEKSDLRVMRSCDLELDPDELQDELALDIAVPQPIEN